MTTVSLLQDILQAFLCASLVIVDHPSFFLRSYICFTACVFHLPFSLWQIMGLTEEDQRKKKNPFPSHAFEKIKL